MKITNIIHNKAYELNSNTKIQVERPNPFFNEYGEQTTPLDIPASHNNRLLLGFPDNIASRKKMEPIDVTIQDDDYFTHCRQIVLSAQYKGAISTAFYIGDGSFYSRIQNINLKDIFKDEYIPEVTTVEQGIDFCRSLMDNTHEQYAIFPVLLTDDSGTDTSDSSATGYKILNAYGLQRGDDFFLFDTSASADFYNASSRTERVDGTTITLAPGYYISPFIRAVYLLRRIFAHFGYTLADSFLATTSPFDKMVVINNVIDVLVNGRIHVADMVPNVSCNDFLSLYRKKFCCEFTVDEDRRVVNIVMLKDILASEDAVDLTSYLTAPPIINYKTEKDYQRITLTADNTLVTDTNKSYDDYRSLTADNPGAFIDTVTGSIVKEGLKYSLHNHESSRFLVAEASQPFNTGETLEAKEIKIPETLPLMKGYATHVYSDYGRIIVRIVYLPFIGSYSVLNSKIVISSTTVSSEDDTKINTSAGSDTSRLMLTFSMPHNGVSYGTISSTSAIYPYERVSQYALYYHGDDGIFNRFYRDYDLFLRNANHTVRTTMLLPIALKHSLPAHSKVLIAGEPFLFNKLTFTLGDNNDPSEFELHSATLMQPVQYADTSAIFPATGVQYRWICKQKYTAITQEEYNKYPDQHTLPTKIIFPPLPAVTYVGNPYALISVYIHHDRRVPGSTLFPMNPEYEKVEIWFECEALQK